MKDKRFLAVIIALMAMSVALTSTRASAMSEDLRRLIRDARNATSGERWGEAQMLLNQAGTLARQEVRSGGADGTVRVRIAYLHGLNMQGWWRAEGDDRTEDVCWGARTLFEVAIELQASLGETAPNYGAMARDALLRLEDERTQHDRAVLGRPTVTTAGVTSGIIQSSGWTMDLGGADDARYGFFPEKIHVVPASIGPFVVERDKRRLYTTGTGIFRFLGATVRETTQTTTSGRTSLVLVINKGDIEIELEEGWRDEVVRSPVVRHGGSGPSVSDQWRGVPAVVRLHRGINIPMTPIALAEELGGVVEVDWERHHISIRASDARLARPEATPRRSRSSDAPPSASAGREATIGVRGRVLPSPDAATRVIGDADEVEDFVRQFFVRLHRRQFSEASRFFSNRFRTILQIADPRYERAEGPSGMLRAGLPWWYDAVDMDARSEAPGLLNFQISRLNDLWRVRFDVYWAPFTREGLSYEARTWRGCEAWVSRESGGYRFVTPSLDEAGLGDLRDELRALARDKLSTWPPNEVFRVRFVQLTNDEIVGWFLFWPDVLVGAEAEIFVSGYLRDNWGYSYSREAGYVKCHLTADGSYEASTWFGGLPVLERR